MEIILWRQMLDPYILAVDELVLKFRHIMQEYKDAGEYSPIESVDGRVKKISSILEKAQKKGIAVEDIEHKLQDIAGVRIICQFVEDIEKVVELIRDRQDMKIIREKDFIRNMKESGYRSYHVIVEYTVYTSKGAKKIEAEIQIRTLAMNFWATIEHSLQYKYKGNIPDFVRDRLTKAADAVGVLDEEMSAVRDVIMDAQDSFQYKSNLVTDILTNMQNLYRVANKREIIKIQDEFFRIFNRGDISQLERFNKELDILAEGYKAQSLM